MNTLIFNRPFRRLALRFIRAYLNASGLATRDGVDDGGYIVWMNPTQYHNYTMYVRDNEISHFTAAVQIARDRGLI